MVVTCCMCVLLRWFVFVLYLEMCFLLSAEKLVFIFVLSAEGGH